MNLAPLNIDRQLLPLLRSLTFVEPRSASGNRPGERRSGRLGEGSEFAEHRPYQPTDSLRHLDPHAWARLRQLLVRTFHAERAQQVHLTLDLSASMAVGKPRKADHAASLALGLAMVALSGRDTLSLRVLAPGAPATPFAAKDPADLAVLLRAFSTLSPGGPAPEPSALLPGPRRADRAILISDLLAPEAELDPLLRALRAGGSQPIVLHILAPEDIDPDSIPSGHLALTDAETGERLEILVDDKLRRDWKVAVGEWIDLVDRTCVSLGIQRIPVPTRQEIGPLFFATLREAGLLR